MWVRGCDCEERRSSRGGVGVVLIRRLLQRCGLGRGARTSREKQHWRLRGLPSAATAYPRMPLSPSPWGTAGPQNIWENNHFRPIVATETLPFLCPGEAGKAERLGRRLFGRHLFSPLWRAAEWYVTSDIWHADASHPRELTEQEGIEKISPLWTSSAHVCTVCTTVYTEKQWK